MIKKILKFIFSLLFALIFFGVIIIGVNYLIYTGLFKEYSIWEYIHFATALTIVVVLFFFTFWGIGILLISKFINSLYEDFKRNKKKTLKEESLNNNLNETKTTG